MRLVRFIKCLFKKPPKYCICETPDLFEVEGLTKFYRYCMTCSKYLRPLSITLEDWVRAIKKYAYPLIKLSLETESPLYNAIREIK